MKANEFVTAGMLRLHRATVADADRLSQFAAETFVDAFGAQNDHAEVEAYVAGAFSPAIQAIKIADPTPTGRLSKLGKRDVSGR